MTDPLEAVLPYNGSSGWSGSETSLERSLFDDSTGVTHKRQQMVLAYIKNANTAGCTWAELGQAFNLHHGLISSVLSNLHKADLIARLKNKRGRAAIYVVPQYVLDRETAPFGRTQKQKTHQCTNCGNIDVL